MKLWIFGFLALPIVILGILLFYLFPGYREYTNSISYINSLRGDEKTETAKNFFGKGRFENFHAGILAGSWSNGIWVWGESGPRYFSADKFTAFVVITGCTQTQYYGAQPLNVTETAGLKDWSNQARPGSYIAFQTGQKSQLRLVALYPEFKSSNTPWLFCHFSVDTAGTR